MRSARSTSLRSSFVADTAIHPDPEQCSHVLKHTAQGLVPRCCCYLLVEAHVGLDEGGMVVSAVLHVCEVVPHAVQFFRRGPPSSPFGCQDLPCFPDLQQVLDVLLPQLSVWGAFPTHRPGDTFRSGVDMDADTSGGVAAPVT